MPALRNGVQGCPLPSSFCLQNGITCYNLTMFAMAFAPVILQNRRRFCEWTWAVCFHAGTGSMVFARSLCSKLLSAHLTCCSRLTGLLLSCPSEALRSVLSDFCRSDVLRCQKMSRYILKTLSRVFKRIVHAVQKHSHVQLGVFRREKLSPATFFQSCFNAVRVTHWTSLFSFFRVCLITSTPSHP